MKSGGQKGIINCVACICLSILYVYVYVWERSLYDIQTNQLYIHVF